MSRAGRPSLTVPNVEITAKIPSDLEAEIALLLIDPMRSKIRYGARSKLIERLLRDWRDRAKEAIKNGIDPLYV